MPTKHSLPSYYLSSPRFNDLQDRFGDYFEQLSAIDKFELIAILAWWQSHDTEVQNNGGNPVSLEDYLEVADLPLRTNPETQLPQTVQILQDCSEGEAISLLVILSNQISERVFAQ